MSNYSNDNYFKQKADDTNEFVNVLDKNNRLKKTIFLTYDVNNPMLLEDQRFRYLLLAKHWFRVDKNDSYSKIIYNPFLKKSHYDKIENVKNHHEKNIDAIFYVSFFGSLIFIKNSFINKKLKGIIKKSVYLFFVPSILISYYYLIKPYYLRKKLNNFISHDEYMSEYTKLELDEKLINKELLKYKIRV